MDYQEFLERISDGVGEFMGESAQVTVNQVVKNNSVRLDGLSILEKDRNISPTIYLNGYYEDYREGRPMSGIVADIAARYESGRLPGNVDVNFFTDYEKAKHHLAYKLINYEKNRELLKQIPHRRFLDLAEVYYCVVMNDALGSATILVYNSHAQMWGVGASELHARAEKNTRRLLGYECRSMEEVMREVFAEEIGKELFGEERRPWGGEEERLIEQMMTAFFDEKERPPMYVMSNRPRINGAACLLYPGVLREFAGELKQDFYVLPSSIHEVIALPVLPGEDPAFLEKMVRQVNATQVEEEEILSDEVYFYDRFRGELLSANM